MDLDSEITLTIKGTGNQYILPDEILTVSGGTCRFDDLPTEIIVNDKKVENISKIIYNLTREENTIVLRWNYKITDCCGMFYDLQNITNIDLSKFDSSSVTDMRGMFFGCTSLTSLD